MSASVQMLSPFVNLTLLPWHDSDLIQLNTPQLVTASKLRLGQSDIIQRRPECSA